MLKRLIDFVLALLGLLVLSPVLALVAVAVRLTSRGPAIFRQKRVGMHRSIFELYKFRTMLIDAPHDVATHLLSAPETYLTPMGGFLRRSSLDELPQLFNILKGDMSVVGPRPALWNQSDLIEERDKYGANDVRPGLTGWAQVNGRDELSVTEKAELDGYYVRHQGFIFDVRCVLATFIAVARARGVVEGAGRSAEKVGRG